jgi:sec-independent protein translocase protein TatA
VRSDNIPARYLLTIYHEEGDMLAGLKAPELLIILAIVILLFGVGRVSRIGSELGQAVRGFRDGLNEGREEVDEELDEIES